MDNSNLQGQIKIRQILSDLHDISNKSHTYNWGGGGGGGGQEKLYGPIVQYCRA